MQVTTISGQQVLFDGSQSDCMDFLTGAYKFKSAKLVNGKYRRNLKIECPGKSDFHQQLRTFGMWQAEPGSVLAGPVGQLP